MGIASQDHNVANHGEFEGIDEVVGGLDASIEVALGGMRDVQKLDGGRGLIATAADDVGAL